MDMEQFFRRNRNWITTGEPHTSYLENSWDKGNPEYVKTNSIQNLHMLWKYLHQIVREAKVSSIPGNPYSILFPDHFCNLTWKNSWHGDLKTPIRLTGHQGYTKKHFRYESNQNAYQLLAFKKSIK